MIQSEYWVRDGQELMPYQTWMDSRTAFSSSVSWIGFTWWDGNFSHNSWNLFSFFSISGIPSLCSFSSLILYSRSWRKALVLSSSDRSSKVPLTVPPLCPLCFTNSTREGEGWTVGKKPLIFTIVDKGGPGPVLEIICVADRLHHKPRLSHHVYDGVVPHKVSCPEGKEEWRSRIVEQEFNNPPGHPPREKNITLFWLAVPHLFLL